MKTFKKNYIKETGWKVYLQEFYETLNSVLSQYYGLNETEKILKSMEKGLLNISSMGTFFSNGKNYIDSSYSMNYSKGISLNNYLSKLLLQCKEDLDRTPNIILTYFIFYIAKEYQEELKSEKGEELVREFSKNFLYSFLENSQENKVTIRVISPMYDKEVLSELNISTKERTCYYKFIKIFLNVYESIITKLPKSFSIPKIEFIYFITEYTRQNQINYLKDIYMLGEGSTEIIKGLIKDIPDLAEDTPEIRAVLNILKKKSKREYIKEFFEESILAELKYIRDNCNPKPFTFRSNETKAFWISYFNSKSFPTKCNIIYKYVPITEFPKLFQKVFSEIIVDCQDLTNYQDIHVLINLAAELALAKYRANNSEENPLFSIVLKDIPNNSLGIVEKIKKAEKKLKNKYNLTFQILPFIKPDSATLKYGHSEPEYIRIISDIHADINRNMQYSYNFGNDYVLCCGDIANDFKTSYAWINSNITHGTMVCGNHLGYANAFPEKNEIENLKELFGMPFHMDNTHNRQSYMLETKMNRTSNRSYLNTNGTEISGINIFGAPLYTNFELFGKDKAAACEMLCKSRINDFKYLKIYRAQTIYMDKIGMMHSDKIEKPYVTNYSPEICKFYFNRALQKFKWYCDRECQNNKPLIFMSHFGVSIHSIADKYKSDPVSAYFASDLTGFFGEILESDVNLRVVCHGHVHENCKYILKYPYGEILVIANPFGYYYEREDNQQDQTQYGYRLKISDIKSTKPWSKIFSNEINNGDIKLHVV